MTQTLFFSTDGLSCRDSTVLQRGEQMEKSESEKVFAVFVCLVDVVNEYNWHQSWIQD